MRSAIWSAAGIVALATAVSAEDAVPTATRSIEEGLAAWGKIYAVASHPRCTNCHVGASGAPMWEGLGYGAARLHGMNIRAGESRIGAETIPCRTCHLTQDSANALPHAPPHILEAWRLPPVELAWLGKSSAEVCAQLKNPETNDDHSIAELADHVTSSPFVAWGFKPGAGRTAPEGSTTTLARQITLWGAAGTPCPPAD